MRYIAFDTETTGVLSESNLLSVCFMILDSNLEVVDVLNLSIKHKVYVVSLKALEVNGIDLLEHDKKSMTLYEARKELLVFLNINKGDKKYIPIGHNISFDIGFIKSSGLVKDIEYSELFDCNVIDTIVLCQNMKLRGRIGIDESLKLSNMCKYFGLKFEEANLHNAEYDIKMTVELLKRINDWEHKKKKRKINN